MYTFNGSKRQDEGATGLGYPFHGPSPAFEDPSSSRSTQPWNNSNLFLKPPTIDVMLTPDWILGRQDTFLTPQAASAPTGRRTDSITSDGMNAYNELAIQPTSHAEDGNNLDVISNQSSTVSAPSSSEVSFNDWLLTGNDIRTTQETLASGWTANCASNLPAQLQSSIGFPLDFGWPTPAPTQPNATSQAKAACVSSQLQASTVQSSVADKQPKSATRTETTRKPRPFKKRKTEHHEESKSEKEPLAGRFRFRVDSDAPAQPEYPKEVSELDRKQRQALREQGGGCIRCRIGHEKCISIGGGPCEPCLAFWNNNLQSRTIIWNGCVRAKLTDVSPYIALQRDDPQKYASIWKFITTNYFYTALKSNKAPELSRFRERQATGSSTGNSSTPIHQLTKEHRHCVFTQTGPGLDFYYAMLALHVLLHLEYNGCDVDFTATINTAGHHALEALDNLIDFRRFGLTHMQDRYGLLVCLFYGLMTMIRLRNRAVRARQSQFVFHEYKNLDIFRLHETARILGHYFVLVCERLRVPQEDWFGTDGKLPSAEGFKYVRGHCGFVSTFEDESDLRSIAELLKTLPIVQDVIPVVPG